ncbi:MAG: L,D-transpeptidase family protein, partial [Pseudomonadota bacterium]
QILPPDKPYISNNLNPRIPSSIPKQSLNNTGSLTSSVWSAPARAETGETDAPNNPMTIVVSLPNQKAHVYRGSSLITSTAVSTGKRGYATKAGIYSILEKRRRHFSNLYNGAPMPYMQRLTWTGTALHAGVVPGYPASHGCIRLPRSFAPKLFAMTETGIQVVVAHSAVSPKPISHPALFQPLPLPMPPALLTRDEPSEPLVRKSSNDAAPAKPFGRPVVLAKAGAKSHTQTPDRGPALRFARNVEATDPVKPTTDAVSTASLEDTTEHAIDPHAAPFLSSGTQVMATEQAPSIGDVTGSVLVSDDVVKHQDRLVREQAAKAQDRLTPATDASVITSASVDAKTLADDAMTQSVEADGSEPANVSDAPLADNGKLAANAAGPTAQGILTVSASPLSASARTPVQLDLALIGVNHHPPLPLERPSVMLSKLGAGAAAAAIEAAEPVSPEPLRVLVTRRTQRDRTVDIQYMLSDMGYLAPQNFDGTRGSKTIRALKAFQKANDMPETGAFTEDVIKKVYEVAGKEEPPQGQLFVRQKFASVFSTPVSFSDPDKPLGTHLFTVMHFERGATQAEWNAISLNDKETAQSALGRIEIPEDVRRNISERLTPGSSLIIADTAINSASLPKGADFLVWDTSKAAKVQRASASPKRRTRTQRTVNRRPARSYNQRSTRSRYTRRSTQRRTPFRF